MKRGISESARTAALVVVAAMGLSACAASRGGGGGEFTRPPDFSVMTQQQRVAAIQQLAANYRSNPRNIGTVIHYSAALRAAGQASQAVVLLERARSAFPDNRQIAIAFAKALSASGRFQQALNIIDQTIHVEAPHWSFLNVKAAILDQSGMHTEARQLYQQALIAAPQEASLYANLGLSYAMTGELSAAEQNLVRASQLPGASGRIRQNLALVIGLQGRFDEARALYAADLTPEVVDNNMAYIRALLTQQNRWNVIEGK